MSRVFTVEDVHDGSPLSGTAEFEGSPHAYQCLFSADKEDWTDSYILKKISGRLLALAIERQDIFLRWRLNFDIGKTSIQTHPALPVDRARYEAIETELGSQLKTINETELKVSGRFEIDRRTLTGIVNWHTE